MTDILRRDLAPVPAAAWDEIDTMAARTLRTHLSGRTIVDVSEPQGWEAASVNLGRLEFGPAPAMDNVLWGTRRVLPLVEVRVPFTLSQLEIDNIVRGAKDADLDPVMDAARAIATFEETAIYRGFGDADIQGICQNARLDPVEITADADRIAHGVADAVEQLQTHGIGGPYGLVLPSAAFYDLMQSTRTGYPVARVIHEVLNGEIYWSPGLADGLVVSQRGGDFELTLGHDFAVGYASHTREDVELYLTESFSFRVLDDFAAVRLPIAAGAT